MSTLSQLPPSRLRPSESSDFGREARRRVPRSSHGEWTPAGDRPDPVDVLVRQAESRVQDLIPIRYGRMLASPFTFYRGAAAVMAADLAGTPDSGVVAQVCGDAHISNFGGFAAPDRQLLFGPNDFDETLPGPWEWDVKRMAASIEIAGRDVGLPAPRRRRLVERAVREYREGARDFAETSLLDTWYTRLQAEELTARFGTRLDAEGQELFARTFAKARRKNSERAVQRLTEVVDGRLRFASMPPVLTPLSELFDSSHVEGQMETYVSVLREQYSAGLHADHRHLFESFEFVDMARKVVGVGSVGTRAWIFLLLSPEGYPLVLQAKEAQASVLEPYLGSSEYENHGERVVRGQRMMQAAPDIFLGWQRSTGLDGLEHDFYVRQLWDWKASADLSRMTERGLLTYSRACAWSLARSHSRSGDRKAIAAYLGSGPNFERAIATFSSLYADQNERDYERLAVAAEDGVIPVERGV
jgi:uncharacterized protein (DUF2252 family)